MDKLTLCLSILLTMITYDGIKWLLSGALKRHRERSTLKELDKIPFPSAFTDTEPFPFQEDGEQLKGEDGGSNEIKYLLSEVYDPYSSDYVLSALTTKKRDV